MVDISVQTLSDAIARYSVKSNPASTSTNNNVPKTVITATSAIISAYRRVHGANPPDGNLGDLTWLTLKAIKGANLSSKDRPLFTNQQNDGASTVLEAGTVRKLLENYKTALYAISKHIGTVGLPAADKKKLQKAYKKARDEFHDANDEYIKAEKARIKERTPSVRQQEKNVPWMTIKESVEPVLQYLEQTLSVDEDDLLDVTPGDIRKVQRGVQLALYTEIPPLRNVFENTRFIGPRVGNKAELESTQSPNYVLISPSVCQLVINKTKNDGRSDADDYDPDVDFAFDHERTLRLDLMLPSAPVSGDSEETVRRKMDQANVIHVLEKYGFQPIRLGNILRLYQKWLRVVLGERNPKQFLFFDPKKGQSVTPLKSEGLKSRLQEATNKVVGKKLGAQMMRPLFLTYFDTKGPAMDDREIVAEAMMHSVATQMGNYTKKTGTRKRLGEDMVQDGAGRAKKSRAVSNAPDF
jgi:hypothetical protein